MTTTAAIAVVSPRAVEDVNRIRGAEVEPGITSSRKPHPPKNQCVIFLS
ncbi:hypothetical protein KMZ29_24475 [Bradyrhizobium sediminis]|uniref:Uncharacterized protein n=1 Tax=Bradyrhizobium sediminis TaxID=2840469 RepID=A0A975NDE6_9BRAD|nr:hypothetical protein [Bradyrhizobium sediminis]QWG12805.1 hypothetical protein KMZ29_24475 [Bradyrhizobium sediminis]